MNLKLETIYLYIVKSTNNIVLKEGSLKGTFQFVLMFVLVLLFTNIYAQNTKKERDSLRLWKF